MRRLFAVIIALLTGANGVAMLVDPDGWFTRVPGVVASGPFNSHFVMDVGIAFIVAGGAFAAFAWRRRLWPAALTGAAFLALHGALHLSEIVRGHSQHALFELALAVAPAAVAVAVAWPTREDQDAQGDRSMVSEAARSPV